MNVQLDEYNQKRNFGRTLEPVGKIKDSEEFLRFVVQHHLASRDHFDFRLEWKGVLLSWAVPKGPSYNSYDKRLAVQVEDHPLEYRNFEGTIPKGQYGGGVVMLWDEGFWEPHCNVEEGISDGMLKFGLKGRRLKGRWALIRLKIKAGETKNNWLLLKEKDEHVKNDDGISQFITSIRTGRTMIEIEKDEDEKITKNPFNNVEVQLAKLVKSVPKEEDWLYELKYDGYRIVSFVEENSARLITRNGNDYTKHFYDIASALIDLAKGRAMVLDGEIVITDEDGKTDFQALQNYFKSKKVKNLTYIIFDLLALNGVDLRNHPLIARKEKLEYLMRDAPKNLYYSRYVNGYGNESFTAACEASMEGIVGKKANSIYSGTRNGDWIKLKCDKRQEFVIGGYSLSDKRTKGVSSLLLGVYEGDKLVYAGRAGTGISESDMKILEDKFENLKKTESPFVLIPKSKSNENITWLEPKIVAEIKFAEWTKENLLRQASFKGLRIDKNPKEIKREKAVGKIELQSTIQEVKKPVKINSKDLVIEGVKISSPNKIIFNDLEITKEDVIRYYSKVSERMLPYVGHRVLSIVRCPKGVSQNCFYKKHPGLGSKGIITIPLINSNKEAEDYFYIENILGLISEAQMGTLEFHTWGSRVDQLERPDMMVFDLDPDEGMDLSRVRKGVEDIKSILDELSLNSYLKTSGGKGYHIVVPLKPSVTWKKFHDFAKQVAEVMEHKWPERYTSNVRKSKRTNKIFIDWIRNARGATSIAPYSLRARKGAKVTMPIRWDELNKVAPDGINMNDALLRISGPDPWEDFFKNNQMLK
ncbi:DNA ligase D [Sedimentibacter sp. MB31-C6]|uniref:DNA ligase D n=1 Tax=Sedimentibacter sp. MB31-C6 TaxID=3109366 RepID=UPI002DDD7815|nr:DNA ligase D [Sedimentibacter sp. MB36-C1]WSI04246.1 DNA ligase D [Sedimentibacter sp. MB36-C1]